MRIFARADGTVIASHYSLDPGDPPGAVLVPETPAMTLDFDSETNTALAENVDYEPHRYRVVTGGVLTKDAVPVTINAPSEYERDREQIEQALTQLDTLIARLDGGTDLTVAQRQDAFLFLLRAVRYIRRWIVKRG